ncbi:hypothetical protein LP416_29765 [Polaromonas sp. P2-4]|nr:hypothetical protein LP416_29765 [Polaromonas sp. P2-4]
MAAERSRAAVAEPKVHAAHELELVVLAARHAAWTAAAMAVAWTATKPSICSGSQTRR